MAGTDDTHGDPSRAPPGAGIFHSSTFAPYRLRDGGPSRWDEIKEQVADQQLEVYRRFTPSLTQENILARTVWSPLDMERHSPNSFVNGDMHGAAPFLHQSLGHRPTPDLGQFTVPGADRLYLVGPYMHPGGGVFGAGRAAAIKAFEELGMNFDRTVAGT